MYSASPNTLIITDDEFVAIHDVLDHTVTIYIAPWPGHWVELTGDKKDLDIVIQLLTEVAKKGDQCPKS